ncbi:MAG: N-acetylmuramoyl-L-alanine amidase [Opitutales bacterium]|nr:N-acetylmuramoyl-L-alanine amidase [Opitutales bacterium]
MPFLRFLSCCLIFLGFCSLSGAEKTLHGRVYVDAESIAARYGMRHITVVASKQVRLQSQWTRLDFKIHQRSFDLNGLKHPLGFPVAQYQGKLWISKSDLSRTLDPLLVPQKTDPKPKLYRIVIDPGHGGKDHGAINNSMGINEKILTLKVAKRLEKQLEALGYQVLLTRESDRYLSLKDRAAFANRANADLFISIHFNAVSSQSVHGIETFVMTPEGQPSSSTSRSRSSDGRSYIGNRNNTWNLQAASLLQRSLIDALPHEADRGVKRARFQVLREVKVPGLLLELGFLTHPATARKLKSEAYINHLADTVKNGIFQYQKKLNEVRGRG